MSEFVKMVFHRLAHRLHWNGCYLIDIRDSKLLLRCRDCGKEYWI